MKIVFGATLSLHPYSPGRAWNRLQHVLGFQRLGHEVYFLEEIRPEWCVDDQGQPTPYERSGIRERFRSTLERFGLLSSACQLYNGGEATVGMSLRQMTAVAKDADLLVNMSGHVNAECVLANVGCRAYVDQDPVYTQLWMAEYGVDLNLAAHEVFFSVGVNIGTPDSPIPSCGLEWHPTIPPVVLDLWPVSNGSGRGAFTTVATWSGPSEVTFRGKPYRSKYEEFARLAELPKRTDQEMELMLKTNSYRNDDPRIAVLRANGWTIADAGAVADLTSYQDYIARSRAEIGVAKHAYVEGRSGWFSDRSAQYLACGKPVLAQSTGFERCLPTGEGLLTFCTVDEAVEGVQIINRDYKKHCLAARAFAEEYLDHRHVLPRMLETCEAAVR